MKRFFLIFMVLHYAMIQPHGFAENTIVNLENNQEFLPIKQISQRFFTGKKTKVCTYKERSARWKTKAVKAVAHCSSNVFFELGFAQNHTSAAEIIKCSPLQLFYRLADRAWIPANQLDQGDTLLCKNGQTTRLQSKNFISQPIRLYIIEVKKHHTFVVGRQKILTHNMFIPIATTIGFSIPFDILLNAGTWGCMFGPVTFCCSIAVAGIAAAIVYETSKQKATELHLIVNGVDSYTCKTTNEYYAEAHVNSVATGCGAETPSYTVNIGCGGEVPSCKIHTGCGQTNPISNSISGCGGFAPEVSYILQNSVEDILKDTTLGEEKRFTKQYIKKGDYNDAVKDFESLNPSHVENLPGKEGKKGILPDGRRVNVREESSYDNKAPTIEIQPPKGHPGKNIKIRYENNSTCKG